MDGEWFRKLLRDRNKSTRGLARHLDIDGSAVSRMFSGQRRMKMEEANAIASFLAVPVSEVLKHAGVSMDLDGLPTRILLAAIIGETGNIERLKDPRPLPQSVIDRAHAAISGHRNGSIVAAQVRAPNGPLAVFDDAVALFAHTDEVEAAAIGALSICRTHDGEQILARIERARKTGEAKIVLTSGKVIEVILHTATPVLAIIP
ncbi:MAG: helix-turn-helix domain-containing protein [Sphingomonas sp.]|uniref:helix-turn-helix domain-containing protein n=1 Tax=Sphingomonas sp. TaxID=28214 RepID=UPI002621BA21|nr:helix-turn-helix transcriptional regulator [Sphingomonas sp.]MDK2769936.1 helix-turn-helix domain-containing protein [Sphingomonas sp.]